MADHILKRCLKCGIDKPLDQMGKSSQCKDGRRSLCKECINAYYRDRRINKYEAVRSYERKFHRERRLRVEFGITEAHYAAMLAEQKGGCAICNAKQLGGRRLAVDHCHATGKIRGLLCDLCNKGIGMFRDSPGILTKAAEYCRGHLQMDLGVPNVMPAYREAKLGRSGVRGVRVENDCFVAYVKDGMAERRVGRFKTIQEAVSARDAAMAAGRM